MTTPEEHDALWRPTYAELWKRFCWPLWDRLDKAWIPDENIYLIRRKGPRQEEIDELVALGQAIVGGPDNNILYPVRNPPSPTCPECDELREELVQWLWTVVHLTGQLSFTEDGRPGWLTSTVPNVGAYAEARLMKLGAAVYEDGLLIRSQPPECAGKVREAMQKEITK